jgi:hypothetical protein
MGLFRGLNLLQSIEAGITLGTGTGGLQEILEGSPARSAEFGAMLSTRHMSRRMAANVVTMEAIVASAHSITIAIERTSVYSFRPMESISKSPAAMGIVSTSLPALIATMDNPTALSYFTASESYDANIKNTLATLIGHDPANYASLSNFILNETAFGIVVTNARAMAALVQSNTAMDIVVNDSPTMADLAANDAAVLITAHSDLAVTKIANSPIALAQVTDTARTIVISVPSALAIFGANHTAWETILSSSIVLPTTIKSLLYVFGGINSENFPTLADIFADTTSSQAIADSHPAMMAIVAEVNNVLFTVPSVLDTIIASDNLTTVLGSGIALEHFLESTACMNQLIGSADGFTVLLTSSAAKAAIFADPALFSTMMTEGSVSRGMVVATAQSATITNNIVFANYKDSGISGNMILLTGVMGSIVATTLDNHFRSGIDGTPSAVFKIPGTSLASGPIPINLPFTDMHWTVNSIAATAAANITITYAAF